MCRRTATVLTALWLLVLAGFLAACGGSAPHATRRPGTTATHARTATVAAKPPKRAKPKRKRKPAPPPGVGPQTHQRPSPAGPAFHAEMEALWAGVKRDSPGRAMAAFFPEAAYLQVKAIGDARADYRDRLLGDYRLDLAAAHALLGADPATARLVAVNVPQSYVHWVTPGTCYNRVGYYEVPNARVVYRQNGGLHSFGIASMISWRGVWYVVHLGAVVRAGAAGIVDDPSLGSGVSAPSSTC